MNEDCDSDERLGMLLEYFAERLNLAYAYFFCAFEFKEDADAVGDPAANDRAWSLQTIKNAGLAATLLAVRDLDDFLTPRNSRSKSDDLKASDFGYSNSLGFLSESERISINKLIVHSTTTGAQSQGLRWDVWELTSKCRAQSFEFLRWVESHYGFSRFSLVTAAICCRTKTQKIHEFFSAEIERQRK